MGAKSQPDPPDYSALANASEESARIMAQLGQQQLDFSKQQYQDMLPFLSGIAGDQRQMMREQMDQARDYYNYQQNTFRPLEQKMVAEADAYNTDAKKEELARQSAADVAGAFQKAQAMNEQAAASMGVNPNSGRFAGMNRATVAAQAAMDANARTQGRSTAEQLGWAKKLDAAGLGRNLPGASAAAYGGANNSGNSAGNNMQQPGSNYLAGMNMGANTIGSGRNMLQSGLGAALSGQANMWANGQNQSNPWMTLLGAGLGAFMSSKRSKVKTGSVNADKVSRSMASIPVDRWRYKPGKGDGGEHIGPYAEDMAKRGAATPDGKMIDVISALGVNTAAIKGLSQRLAKVENRHE